MEEQNEYYNNHNSYISPAFGTPNGSMPTIEDRHEYKLYIRPVAPHYDEASLTELFSTCGTVTEVYISPISELTGFRWAFIYYTCQAAADEAVRRLNNFEKYGFKVKHALYDPTKKKFSKTSPLDETTYSKISEVGTKVETNGVSFVSPPNCKFCKKLTFFACGSCQNSFCNTECALDGWRFHTSECIKVANLVHTDDTKKVSANGITLSDTVVNFMKNISISKKNFSADEFAAAVKPAPIMPEKSAQVFPEYKPAQCFPEYKPPLIFPEYKPAQVFPEYKPEKPIPKPEYELHNNDSSAYRKPVARKFPNDNDNAATFGKKCNNDAPSYSKKFNNDAPSYSNKFNNDVQPFAKKFNNFSSNDNVRSSKPNRSYYEPNSDTEEENPPTNGYRRDERDSQDSHISFRPKKSMDKPPLFNNKRRSNDSDNERKPARNFEPRGRPPPRDRPSAQYANKPAPFPSTPAPQPEPTDLNLQVGKTIEAIVTSIVDEKTFFIADPEKCTESMKRFNEEVVALPILECPKVNIYCFSLFEGGWYRAKILSMEPLKVYYIDFGNEAEVERNELKVMPFKFKKMLPLASKVRLSSGTIKDKEIAEFDQPIIHPKEQDDSGVWIVDVL